MSDEWRYEVKYGPEGEDYYAWVYCGKEMIATMKTYNAVDIVKAMNSQSDGSKVIVIGEETIAALREGKEVSLTNGTFLIQASNLAPALTNTSGDDEAPVAWTDETELKRVEEYGHGLIWDADGQKDMHRSEKSFPLYRRPQSAVDEAVQAPFAYWVEHKFAEPVALRPPSYIPDGPNYTVTPLYARPQSAAVRDGWQPIETAPKDGTLIDLWHEEFGRFTDMYWGNPEHCCGEAGSYCDSEWHGQSEGWVFSVANEIIAGEHDTYTHWMPLPAAPSLQSTQEGL